MKCKIFKNLWAGYETYFIRMRTSEKYTTGIKIVKANNGWKVAHSTRFYTSDIKNDHVHFPIVGEIDIDKLILDSVLNIVKK